MASAEPVAQQAEMVVVVEVLEVLEVLAQATQQPTQPQVRAVYAPAKERVQREIRMFHQDQTPFVQPADIATVQLEDTPGHIQIASLR